MNKLRLNRHRLLPIFLLMLTTLAGCSSAGAPARPEADVGNSLAGDNSGDTPATAAPVADQQVGEQQLIVYTGSIQLEVGDLRAAMDQANQAISAVGGHVASSRVEASAGDQHAVVTYRIPADRWSEALAAIRAAGTRVINESTDSSDVTAQVVDMDARITNLRATEAALQEIMNRAGTIDDVLEVQRELTKVRSDIETLTAQRDVLGNRAALATLEVTFGVPVVATTVATGGWDLGHEVDNALATLVRVGQGLTSLGVWLLIVVLPVVLPVALALYIGVRLRRRWLATHPAPEPVLATAPGTPPPGPWKADG